MLGCRVAALCVRNCLCTTGLALRSLAPTHNAATAPGGHKAINGLQVSARHFSQGLVPRIVTEIRTEYRMHPRG